MASTFDPWDFIEQGRYREFVTYYDRRQAQWQPRDWREPGARASGHLLLGQYQKAVDDLQLAQRFADEYEGPNHSPYSEDLGGALWLSGQRDAAAEEWLRYVNGLLDHSINYADYSGGTGACMLLRFASLELNRPELEDRAKLLLKKLIKSSRIRTWPGPLAFFALGKKSIEDIALENFGSANPESTIEISIGNKLLRRYLCQALFYWAQEKLRTGDEECFMRYINLSVDTNAVVEIEWHLAKATVR